ncbi:hypothetical protein ACHHYP_13656 [Achlya hypogyna]|uniref:Transmembrane protein n=1 Tax=Achlya hypogyna TaxID=1202772 RepID=A0A1V9ZFH8_ACHHY|nr:hypothetical protein ACHHYP_13656 [Achlya hypogyna]
MTHMGPLAVVPPGAVAVKSLASASITHRCGLARLVAALYVLSTVASSVVYLVLMARHFENDYAWRGFNTTAHQTYLADLINMLQTYTPLDSPVDLLAGDPITKLQKSYGSPATTIDQSPTYSRQLLLNSIPPLTVIPMLRQYSWATAMYLFTQYCWLRASNVVYCARQRMLRFILKPLRVISAHQPYLANWFNTQLQLRSDAVSIVLDADGFADDRMAYNTTGASTVLASTLYPAVLLQDAASDVAGVISALRTMDVALVPLIFTPYCFVDLNRTWEMANSAARQARCYTTPMVFNGAVYLEALVANVDWSELAGTSFWSGFESGVLPQYISTRPGLGTSCVRYRRDYHGE